MAQEVVYIGRDNTIDLLLKAENDAGVSVAQDLSGITQIIIIFNEAVSISSVNNETGLITWAVDGYDTGEIRISLDEDAEANLVDGHLYSVSIVVFDAGNTDGIVWGTIGIRAKDI